MSYYIHTNKYQNKHYYFIYALLAWEPSAAKVTECYPRRLPALERFYRETKFNKIKNKIKIKI